MNLVRVQNNLKQGLALKPPIIGFLLLLFNHVLDFWYMDEGKGKKKPLRWTKLTLDKEDSNRQTGNQAPNRTCKCGKSEKKM